MPIWVAYIAPAVIALIALGTVLWRGGRWTGSVDSQLSDIKKEIGSLKSEFGSLRKLVESALSRPIRTFVGSTSPVSLTKHGERAAGILNGREWAHERAGDLVAKCEGLKEYEIYDLCQEYVMADRGRWPSNMDECAYEFGAPVEFLASVLMVVLRDEILRILKETGSKVS